MGNNPSVAIIAGPNGAGKSTAAPDLLKDILDINIFVNADTIARGLSGFNPERSALEAGKIMLKRIYELADEKKTFSFETTLAARSFVPWLKDIQKKGYSVHILYMWLSSPDLAVTRVQERVMHGGHSIPEHVIRRRYNRSIKNFFELYMPICQSWRLYNNASITGPQLAAFGNSQGPTNIQDRELWDIFKGEINNG